MPYMATGKLAHLGCKFVLRMLIYFGVSRFCLQVLLYQMAAFVLYSFSLGVLVLVSKFHL